jgi:hypothetical protein
MKKGQLTTKCSNCKRVYTFTSLGYTRKILDYPEGIIDIGIECPNCEHFTHSHYLTEELEGMQDKDADRKQRRRYKRKFLKLQRWVTNKRRNMSQAIHSQKSITAKGSSQVSND